MPGQEENQRPLKRTESASALLNQLLPLTSSSWPASGLPNKSSAVQPSNDPGTFPCQLPASPFMEVLKNPFLQLVYYMSFHNSGHILPDCSHVMKSVTHYPILRCWGWEPSCLLFRIWFLWVKCAFLWQLHKDILCSWKGKAERPGHPPVLIYRERHRGQWGASFPSLRQKYHFLTVFPLSVCLLPLSHKRSGPKPQSGLSLQEETGPIWEGAAPITPLLLPMPATEAAYPWP